MKIIFRTNAGKEGLGHLNRMYSLFIALQTISSELTMLFLVNEDAKIRLLSMGVKSEEILVSEDYSNGDYIIYKDYSPHIIILDTYKAAKEYVNKLKTNQDTIIVLFDDTNTLYDKVNVDILVNGNIYANSLDYKTKINYQIKLTGSNYLVMNPSYFIKATKTSHNEVNSKNKMLITCGGSDPHGIMAKLIDWTRNIQYFKKVIIGPYFNKANIDLIQEKVKGDENYQIIYKPLQLKDHYEECSLVLTAAGSSVYEALILKKPLIIYLIGEDQSLIANHLEDSGIINLGWHHQLNEDHLTEAYIKASNQSYHSRLKDLFNEFDGNGSLRVAKEIIKYAEQSEKVGVNDDIFTTNSSEGQANRR